MQTSSTKFATTIAIGALALTPSVVAAQDRTDPEPFRDGSSTLELELRGGAALPAEALTDYAGVGLRFGADAALWLGDHVALRFDANVDALPGEDEGVQLLDRALPDMRMWYVGGGFDFDATGREDTSPLSLEASVGAGATTLDTDDFDIADTPQQTAPVDITETYPAIHAGVEMGYDVTRRVQATVGSTAFLTFVDDRDLAILRQMNPAAEDMDMAVLIPITASLSIALPNMM